MSNNNLHITDSHESNVTDRPMEISDYAHLYVNGNRATLLEVWRPGPLWNYYLRIICHTSGRTLIYATPDDVPDNSVHCDCLGGSGYFLRYKDENE